jgi:DNA mismatch endonuclease (patch repair protein)
MISQLQNREIDGRLRTGTRPVPSSLSVQIRMQRQRSRNTPIELTFRSLVHHRGLRFRVHQRPIPELRRTADLVFRAVRVAAYVDGCFWHGCPDHYTEPHANANYWLAKIELNRLRDADTDAKLAAAGWLPFRVWEHENLNAAAERLSVLVAKRLRIRSL